MGAVEREPRRAVLGSIAPLLGPDTLVLPAMILSWILGLSLIWVTDAFASLGLWLVVKLVAVVALTGFHFWLARFVRAFAEDERPQDERFFRIINEIPTVLLIVIVIMAVVKP